MPKSVVTTVVLILALAAPAFAQVGGNSGYSQSGAQARAEAHERELRTVAKDDLPPNATSSYVDAGILLNQAADSYVAVFSIASDGATPADCGAKSAATLKALTAELAPLGIAAADLAVDWVAQTKVYGYELEGNILQEKLVGYELKENVAVPYRDAAMLEGMTLAAARAQVFDLVKVDYVVKDLAAVHERLMAAASDVIRAKVASYEKLLGIKLVPPVQILAERSAVYYPARLYDNYSAQETEAVGSTSDRQRYTIHGARKSTTFFYNGLDGDGFDTVINPVVTAPQVQFTLYLKLKYEVAGAKGR
jgi:uncharacterized protein YggE